MSHARTTRLLTAGLLSLTLLHVGAASAERVELRTEDGFQLVGNLLAGEPEAPAVILLHMYRSSRTAWAPLVPKLRAAGYTVLAIDQRAHGESTDRNGEAVRVAELPRGGFTALVREGVHDVAAARALLASRGLGGSGVALVGASYGCTVSLLSSQAAEGIAALVLLSPGTAYFGVDALEAAAAFPGPLLAVAAEDDRDVAAQARAIVEAHPGQDELAILSTGGHGTRLFAPRPEVMARIVEFLDAALPR